MNKKAKERNICQPKQVHQINDKGKANGHSYNFSYIEVSKWLGLTTFEDTTIIGKSCRWRELQIDETVTMLAGDDNYKESIRDPLRGGERHQAPGTSTPCVEMGKAGWQNSLVQSGRVRRKKTRRQLLLLLLPCFCKMKSMILCWLSKNFLARSVEGEDEEQQQAQLHQALCHEDNISRMMPPMPWGMTSLMVDVTRMKSAGLIHQCWGMTSPRPEEGDDIARVGVISVSAPVVRSGIVSEDGGGGSLSTPQPPWQEWGHVARWSIQSVLGARWRRRWVLEPG